MPVSEIQRHPQLHSEFEAILVFLKPYLKNTNKNF